MIVTFLRTIILYFTLIIAIRLMGKRQIGEMEPTEFVVALVISDLAAVPMQDPGIPLFSGIVPILTVLSLELLLAALSFSSVRVRRLICGTPVILMENGAILYPNLRKTRVTVNELVEHLRESGITDLATVQYAILETNGTISALRYSKYEPADAKDAGVHVEQMELPVIVISDGRWQKENLSFVRQTKRQAEKFLKENGCTVKDVALLTVTPSGKWYLSAKKGAATN
ncbi:MAG: DUF421 domain-containing protein [Oscillospiraceae bacterium]|nr:DUF421 domain-containing protein [Oscillospiraceae bacterium]